MSVERAAMRGRLEEAKQTRERCRNAIRGNADAIRTKLNTLLTPPDELDVPLVDELWDALKNAWAELLTVNSDIQRLERELR
jgi:hypothetical protein